VNLNADLVERCKSEFGSFSAHVEPPLSAGQGKRAAAVETEGRRTVRAIGAFAALYVAQGSLSAEIQNL